VFCDRVLFRAEAIAYHHDGQALPTDPVDATRVCQSSALTR
jgi:hypothetical protein